MTDYIIGDVHGCVYTLIDLFTHINFNRNDDTVWFTGDLVNRGPHSLDVLRLVYDLGACAQTVLGNHDIALLADLLLQPKQPLTSCYEVIQRAPDCAELTDMLVNSPLLYQSESYMLVHAGLPPQWDLAECQLKAREIEHLLRSGHATTLLGYMYQSGDYPYQYALDALTRIRFCYPDGTLDLQNKSSYTKSEARPWFQFSQHAPNKTIFFGHWSALQSIEHGAYICIDTACVWGQALTAYNLNLKKHISVPTNKYDLSP